MLGAYYLHVDSSVRWVPKEKIGLLLPSAYFKSPEVSTYWVVPDKLPGETIPGGKVWIAKVIAEMAERGGKKEDIRQAAVYGFSMPEDVFRVLYDEVMGRRQVN